MKLTAVLTWRFMPFGFSAEVVRFRLTGTEPPGPYAWLGGLTLQVTWDLYHAAHARRTG